ncbi:NAD-dependent epimerase/dehydratase family protein [Streptosporangium saharense]|uniref:NAD-dependent epimerase/dehydratase family protein n=1 Tax=Streptosporangium saharense TaxID=1706840 RepID=UPI0036D12917
MRLLVLGGTHFVGRAVVEEAVRRGDEITLVNRGRSPLPEAVAAAVEPLVADRTDAEALRAALDGREWDAVVDTWSGAPKVVGDACGLLSGRVGHYGYVSSRSVYSWPFPPGADESAPVVEGDPDSEVSDDYAQAKRGSELAVLRVFGENALLARAGLVLGPYENIGRLPWWLRRVERGGRVLAPGRPGRPLQYIDARDIAVWMLGAAQRGVGGAFNTVSHPGHATMGELLDEIIRVTGSDAELVWAPDEVIAEAEIAAWTELPVWLPEGGEEEGLHDGNVSAAHAAGLVCRPVRETVADTWAWLQAEGDPALRTDRPSVGLDPAKEAKVLADLS